MKILEKSFIFSFNCLLISLPFSAVSSNFLPYLTETLLLISILLGLLSFVKIDLKFLKRNKILLFYVGFVFLIGLKESSSLKNLIFGIKYEILYILIFLFFNAFKKDFNYQKSFTYFLNASYLALGLSLIIWIFTNNNFLTQIGYRNDWSTFYSGQKQAICQKIQDNNLCRFQGFLSSPNHYGLHLLFLNFLSNNLKVKVLSFLTCLLTFSRSSLLAFLSFYGLLKHKILSLKHVLIASFGALFLIIYSLKFANLSSNEHILKFLENLPLAKDHLFTGHGLNFAGPASRVGEVLIPESHFLQVLLNTGSIGFGLFLAAYINLIIRFWNTKYQNAYLLCALIIPMLFLHPLEDSSLSIALFAYLALEEAFLSKV